jgi:PilZ domain
MPTTYASPQSVKSVSQRALVYHWDRLAAGRRFPVFTEFKLEPGMPDPKQLVVWNIEGRGPHLKFRALYQGENVAEVFSSAWAGKTMDQVVPMSLRRVTLDAAKGCVRSGCAIYTIVSTIDTHERRVDCERLLLPFGRDGSRVEQILGSLQLTSVAGGVRRKKILNNFQMQADVLLLEKIKSGFTHPASTIATIDASGTYAEPNKPLQTSEQPALSDQAGAAVPENRGASRRNIRRAGRISFAGESKSCTVRNISATGAAIEVANLHETPDTFTLIMEMESAARPCTVVWRKETQMGVRFI